VYLTHAGDPSREVQDPLAQRCLPRIDMGHDADIAEVLQRHTTRQGSLRNGSPFLRYGGPTSALFRSPDSALPEAQHLKLCRTVRVLPYDPYVARMPLFRVPGRGRSDICLPPSALTHAGESRGAPRRNLQQVRYEHRSLPAIVREGLVCLRHPVRVVPLLYGSTIVLGGSHELGGQLFLH